MNFWTREFNRIRFSSYNKHKGAEIGDPCTTSVQSTPRWQQQACGILHSAAGSKTTILHIHQQPILQAKNGRHTGTRDVCHSSPYTVQDQSISSKISSRQVCRWVGLFDLTSFVWHEPPYQWLVSADAAARLHSYKGRVRAGFQLNARTRLWHLNWPNWLLDSIVVNGRGRRLNMNIARAIRISFNRWAIVGITLNGAFVKQPCAKPSWMAGRKTVVRPPHMKRGNPSIPWLIHMSRERMERKKPSVMGRVCCHPSSNPGCLHHFLCIISSSPIRGTDFLWVWDDNCLPKKLQTGFLDSWWIFFRQLTITVVLLWFL